MLNVFWALAKLTKYGMKISRTTVSTRSWSSFSFFLQQGELLRALGGVVASGCLLGVPLGHNSSFLQGPAFAPPRIREAMWCGSTNSTTEEGKIYFSLIMPFWLSLDTSSSKNVICLLRKDWSMLHKFWCTIITFWKNVFLDWWFWIIDENLNHSSS